MTLTPRHGALTAHGFLCPVLRQNLDGKQQKIYTPCTNTLGLRFSYLGESAAFYVYALFRPWNGQPFYVGKGSGDRLIRHQATNQRQHNPHLANTLKRATRLGLEVPRIKLREGLTEDEAHRTEIAFITAIGRSTNGGPLTNRTDGGEGTTGHVHTKGAKEKIGAASAGHILSAEARAKISAKKRGQKHTPESRAKIKAAKTGVTYGPPSAEKRAKISATLKGKKHTAERRANITAAVNDPQIRAGRQALWDRFRGIPLSEETKEKISLARAGQKQSEAHKAKTRTIMLEIWKRRKAARHQLSEGQL